MTSKVLVYRFSSFGDVLIAIPVIISALDSNPNLEICFVTKSNFVEYLPKHGRLKSIGYNLEKDYKGFLGLLRLYLVIKKEGPFDSIIDLHRVIRTQILNILFGLTGRKSFKLSKNRKSRRDYISGKERTSLPRTMELYQTAFLKAGIKIHLKPLSTDYYPTQTSNFSSELPYRVGLAPFAKHRSKIWPLDKFKELIQILDKQWNIQYVVFGSQFEFQSAATLKSKNIINTCGTLSPEEEISIIRQLDLMVSMDSANMHLADIVGTRVVSIWGGTHPDIGFRPSFQDEKDSIITNIHLDCQPCSIFGKSTCKLSHDQFICMNSIEPCMLAQNISDHFKEKH